MPVGAPVGHPRLRGELLLRRMVPTSVKGRRLVQHRHMHGRAGILWNPTPEYQKSGKDQA
eukprot:281786-Prorocentrum_minimum.AAC.1